jgi:hypothetical protein
MSTTSDPNDPDLRVIEDSGMQKSYLVLSDEERAKGFVRPVRRTYIHDGGDFATCHERATIVIHNALRAQ